MTSLGAGIFISTISQTQQQAMMTTVSVLSALLFVERLRFPDPQHAGAIQYLTFLNPVRYFMEIVRGIFLKGSGVSFCGRRCVALAIFGVVILTLSSLRFRKRLD